MRLVKGSTVYHLYGSDMERFTFLLPKSLKEQQKIAEILSTVDDTIEKTDDLIEKYKKIKTGLMEDLFTKGIDVNTGKSHTKFKDSELGRIPESWEVDNLDSICEVTSSKRIFLNEYKENGTPFYRGKEISEKIKGKELTNLLYISESKFNSIKKAFGIPNEGDILVTAVGTLGNIYLVDNKDNFYFKDGNLIWLRKYKKNINKTYLKYMLSMSINIQIDNLVIGTSQKAFTINKLKSMFLYLPSIKEQDKITEILIEADNKIEKEEIYKEKLMMIKKGLMSDLLTGKVRVEY